MLLIAIDRLAWDWLAWHQRSQNSQLSYRTINWIQVRSPSGVIHATQFHQNESRSVWWFCHRWIKKFTRGSPNQTKTSARRCIVGDDLCLFPIKTLDQNQQLAVLGNLLWPISVCYLVTFVSKYFYCPFQAYPADSKVKY